MSTYFIDESGHTGDAARTGAKFDFGPQPMFSLACVGVDDLASLEGEFARLKTLYGVQSAELKSSSIRNKHGFVRDLVTYLKRQRCPIFIEVVDKKFFICAYIVSTVLMPPVGEVDLTPEAHFLRNIFADYLHAHIPDRVLRSIIGACDHPSTDTIERMFAGLARWLSQRADDIVKGALRFVDDTWSDFKQLAPGEDYLRFLPIPDKGKREQTYWMLPNLSSFTNIYARLNLYHGGNVSDVTLVHDEQAHFDAILTNAKCAVEGLSGHEYVIEVPNADYRFTQKARLRFERSGGSVGIQVADCLAGFVVRYAADGFCSKGVDDATAETFQHLLTMTDAKRGAGVNFVLASRDIARLGVHID
jgi:hypothetical protein